MEDIHTFPGRWVEYGLGDNSPPPVCLGGGRWSRPFPYLPRQDRGEPSPAYLGQAVVFSETCPYTFPQTWRKEEGMPGRSWFVDSPGPSPSPGITGLGGQDAQITTPAPYLPTQAGWRWWCSGDRQGRQELHPSLLPLTSPSQMSLPI